MKVVYIAGPFRGKTAWDVERNVRRAESWSMRVAEAGAVPLCPHTMFRYFNGTLTDEFWLRATLYLLRKCDGAVFIPFWEESVGARGEWMEAGQLLLPRWAWSQEKRSSEEENDRSFLDFMQVLTR